MMGVKHERWRLFTGTHPLREYIRMGTRNTQQLNGFEAYGPQQFRDCGGRPLHLCWIETRGGNARDACERDQLLHRLIEASVENLKNAVRGRHGARTIARGIGLIFL